MTVSSGADRQRICVFTRSWEPGLGDFIQRNVFLALVRRAHPSAEVVHVVDAKAAARFVEFFENHSYASRILICPDYRDEDPARWRTFFGDVAHERFDACVVDPDSRGLAASAAARCGIPERIGFAIGGADDEFLTLPIRLHRSLFGLPDLFDYATGLAGALGIGRLRPSEVVPPFPYRPEPVQAGGFPVVAIHPGGAKHWNRRWPAARYVELCVRLAETDRVSVLLVGSADEENDLDAMRAAVVAAVPAVNVTVSCGESLNRLASRLDGIDIFVGSDSAPAHLAAALRKPTVVLYGPTMTEFMWSRVYPRHHGINLRYDCQTVRNLPRGSGTTTMPCRFSCHYPYESAAGPYPRCLTDIAVDDVFRAVRHQLAPLLVADRPKAGVARSESK